MKLSLNLISPDTAKAVSELREATAAKKCWRCGCLHSTLKAIDAEISPEARPAGLSDVMADSRAKLVDVEYDCLGCEVCWPANAVNALGIEGEACPAEPMQTREGWPPLPGSYAVLHYHAPVAVCTLSDSTLAAAIAQSNDPAAAIVGTMFTENLGIERLIANVLANPNIRSLIVCGKDSGQQIGHLAGQSLVALARNGLDERMKIIGARGKRPRIKNLFATAVEHFRNTVEIIDMVNNSDRTAIRERIERCADKNPGPAQPFSSQKAVKRIEGHIPNKMVSDPAGYFVVYPDRARKRLLLEHYQNNGVLDIVIEGSTASELYFPVIERGLISRLDHAAYLGRELTRAERSLSNGDTFIQDAAPERLRLKPPESCGCQGNCGEAS